MNADYDDDFDEVEGNEPPPLSKEERKLYNSAWYSCLWHLERRPKTEFELRRNLHLKKKIPEHIIDATMVRLKEAGYVDDVDYAQGFVYSKREYSRLGKNSIRQKLREKGVDSEIIDEALSDITEDDELTTAMILGEKRWHALRRETDLQKKKQKFYSFMAYRGHGYGISSQVLKEIISSEEESGDSEDFVLE